MGWLQCTPVSLQQPCKPHGKARFCSAATNAIAAAFGQAGVRQAPDALSVHVWHWLSVRASVQQLCEAGREPSLPSPTSSSSSSSSFLSGRHIWHLATISLPSQPQAQHAAASSGHRQLPPAEQQLLPQQRPSACCNASFQPPAPSSEASGLGWRVMKHTSEATASRAAGLLRCKAGEGLPCVIAALHLSSAQLRPYVW